MPEQEQNYNAEEELHKKLKIKNIYPNLVFAGSDHWRLVETTFIYLEDPANLRVHLKKYAGFEPNTAQSKDISVCLSQGRELLQSARQAGLRVRPLIAFYAMHSLAKAVALAYGRPKRLIDFPAAHGLRDLPGIHSSSVEDIKIAVTKQGIFQSFVEALRLTTGFPIQHMQGAHCWAPLPTSSSEDLEGLEVTLKDLFARLPGVGDFFRLAFGEPPWIARASSRIDRLSSDRSKLSILLWVEASGITTDWARSLNPKLQQWGVIDSNSNRVTFSNFPPNANYINIEEEMAKLLLPIEPLLFPMEITANGEAVILGSFSNLTLPDLAIQYMVSFLLSSIARYRPELWDGFVGASSKDSKYRVIVEKFFDLMFERYPLQILTVLTGSRFIFRNPGLAMG
jgi:YaaC-like Protein